MSATGTGASVSTPDGMDLSGAFGAGMQYFMANEQERKQIAANATTLEEDEWKTLSDAVVRVYHENLVGIQDLQNAGLTRNISLATVFDQWQDLDTMTEAEVSIDGETQSAEDRGVYSTNSVPIPIVHKDFSISERLLMSSRQLNNDLRTDNVAESAMQVSMKLEEILFQGWNPTLRDEDGNTAQIDGYTTASDRNTVTGSDWGTPGNIRDDIVDMLDALDDDNRTPGNSGFWLYVAPTQWQEFRAAIDPDGDGNLTVRERVQNEFGEEIGAIRRAEHLPDGEAVMVDPKPDVVELATAEDVQTVEWQSGSGMTNHYKVMAAMAPEVKSDAQGQSGVAHATGI